MMRSLFSGVSGLKVHQTKMDVIGNNIANVNTVGFKSSSARFSDVLYQNLQNASGASEETGKAGQNAKQVGLGAGLASITTNITGTGGSQRTDNPFDLMINGDSFFVVNVDGQNYFSKAGSFNVDAAGTLCTPSGGKVMGWQVNETGTDVVRDTVSPLQIMSAENLYAPPEATSEAYVTGNIDQNDASLASDANGVAIQVGFYDKIGDSYNIQMRLHESGATGSGKFKVSVKDVVDADGKSIFVKETKDATGKITYGASAVTSITLGGVSYAATVAADGKVTLAPAADEPTMEFDVATGKFKQMKGASTAEGAKSLSFTIGANDGKDTFRDINIDFSTITKYAKSDKCSLESHGGKADGKGVGAGRKVGEMTGISVDSSGKIYGSYDNGITKLLGQIAVATFANPSGLEAIGNNMFKTTQNSGEFDGIGKDPSEGGNSLTPGVLEMSNVDLSSEFTEMIITQRGFQANSRIITTSDTLLEELINLKR